MTGSKTARPVGASVPVDWEGVHRRLAKAQAAIDQGWVPTQAQREDVFRERARLIAQELPSETAPAESLEVVEFSLAHERYAIASASIREIYPLTDITPLPCTPAFVLGVINVRGRILSVIDIKRLFDLPEKGLTDLNKVVIVQAHGLEMGILADTILGVHLLRRKEIQPSIATLTGIREDYLVGVTRERVVILDVEKLLSDKTICVQESVIG
ncbi:MAG: chemotaxis protein CheW [Acidiferrobacter sp.]